MLDELVRVLAPGGLLLISSPNRGVDQPGNPYHLHEFTPRELEGELAARFSHVDTAATTRLRRLGSVVGRHQPARETVSVEGLVLHKLAAGAPGDEIYTVAMASDDEPPRHAPARRHGRHPASSETGSSVFETQTGAIAEKDNYIDELEARLEERDRLTELLGDAEHRLAQVPELNLRIADLEFELARLRAVHAAAARQEAGQLDQMLMYGRRMLEIRRPLIKPLAPTPTEAARLTVPRSALDGRPTGAVRQSAPAHLPDLQVPRDLLGPLPDPDLPAPVDAAGACC